MDGGQETAEIRPDRAFRRIPSALSTKAQEQAKNLTIEAGSNRTKPRSGNIRVRLPPHTQSPSGRLTQYPLLSLPKPAVVTHDTEGVRPSDGRIAIARKTDAAKRSRTQKHRKETAPSPRAGSLPTRFRAAASPKPRPNEASPRSAARPSSRARGSHTRYRPIFSRCRRPGGRRSCAAHARR